MSVRFGDLDLFGSGDSTLHVGGRALRRVVDASADGVGVVVHSHGVDEKKFTQKGALLADRPAQLYLQCETIETMIDGQSRTLVHEHPQQTQQWNDVVMLAFDPKPMERVGTRWRVRYRVDYIA